MSELPTSESAPTLEGVIAQLATTVEAHQPAPSKEQIQYLCDCLYAASLLKEEGRAVRARVVIAPPEAFALNEGPPQGIHAIRFSVPLALTAPEIKRLSPAASFYHSVIAVWPDKDRGFTVWGILNSGPRWMNLIAGGRKPGDTKLPFPMIHVRDPGWLLFYQDYSLIAEWRGREFHCPRMDVFGSQMMSDRFATLRKRLVADALHDVLPATLSADIYEELIHRIAMQFLRRVVNLVRTSGHGGSLVLVPRAENGNRSTDQWIDCKYAAAADSAGLRIHHIIEAMLCRLGNLCASGTDLETAWQVFMTRSDAGMDELEEAFFELARLYSDMMQVDGALVLEHGLGVVGFGGEIRVDLNVLHVEQAHDLDRSRSSRWNVFNDGTRHRSVYRLCAVDPGVVGYVISQDGQVRMIANVDDTVTFWMHSFV